MPAYSQLPGFLSEFSGVRPLTPASTKISASNDCDHNISIFWDEAQPRKRLFVRISKGLNAAIPLSDYKFVTITLSKLPSDRLEQATTSQIFLSSMMLKKVLPSKGMTELRGKGSTIFTIDLEKLLWSDALSSSFYRMPPKEIPDGGYFVSLHLEKQRGVKNGPPCDLYSNELTIDKTDLVNDR